MHEEPGSPSGVCPQKPLRALEKKRTPETVQASCRLEGNGQAASLQQHEGWDDLEILKNNFGSRGEETDLQLLGQ